GITRNPAGGPDLWVVDRAKRQVFHYASGADFRDGQHAANDTFLLATGNSAPEGIADPDGSSTLTVYVGYADNLRPSPFFPNPWKDSPNTVFVGSTSGDIDAGALLIVNNDSAPITVNDVSVTLPGGQQFDLWGSHVVPVGGQLILTQTTAFNF